MKKINRKFAYIATKFSLNYPKKYFFTNFLSIRLSIFIQNNNYAGYRYKANMIRGTKFSLMSGYSAIWTRVDL